MNRFFRALTLVTVLALLLGAGLAAANGPIDPSEVEVELHPNESIQIEKSVTTPPIPPKVDICLLEDETGSFSNDIGNLQTPPTASEIYENVVAVSPGARFAVAGFRDYPVSPHGSPGDWVYRLLSAMSSVKANWLAGIAALTAGGGADGPEAQYDAIVAAVQGGFGQDSCGFDPDPLVTKALVVTTDAPFHLPGLGKPHVNTQASTIAALNAAAVKVVGLKAPGAGGELDALAAATGGNVQPLSSSGADIADAILAGLGNLPVDVEMRSDCEAPISVTFNPPLQTVTSGDDALFAETIAVANDAEPGTYECRDWALINGEPMTDPDTGEIIYEHKRITMLDGRLTGGGSIPSDKYKKVTHGFELHCASVMGPNNLQVNWGKGNKFHLESLTSAVCSDDANIDESPPVAGFDTYVGSGTGRYNGVSGAKIEFKLTDAGEPGKNDEATMKIWDANNVLVLDVSGKLKNGNHQAHKEKE